MLFKILQLIASVFVCPFFQKSIAGGVMLALIPCNLFNCVTFWCFYSIISKLNLGLLNSVNGEGKEYSKNRALYFSLICHLIIMVPFYILTYRSVCKFL